MDEWWLEVFLIDFLTYHQVSTLTSLNDIRNKLYSAVWDFRISLNIFTCTSFQHFLLAVIKIEIRFLLRFLNPQSFSTLQCHQ